MTDGSEPPFRVAITIDAEHPDRTGFDPDGALRLIDALAESHARATFFLQGRWVEACPAQARAVAAAGHLIGSHSFYHARMPLLTDDGIATDVRDAEAVIRDLVDVDPKPWFRCPFGAGHDDARVLAGLDRLGYRNVHWHVAAEDWEPDRDGERIAAEVVSGVCARGDGAIVLLHSWPAATAAALPRILDRLGALGATFVGVDDLD